MSIVSSEPRTPARDFVEATHEAASPICEIVNSHVMMCCRRGRHKCWDVLPTPGFTLPQEMPAATGTRLRRAGEVDHVLPVGRHGKPPKRPNRSDLTADLMINRNIDPKKMPAALEGHGRPSYSQKSPTISIRDPPFSHHSRWAEPVLHLHAIRRPFGRRLGGRGLQGGGLDANAIVLIAADGRAWPETEQQSDGH